MPTYALMTKRFRSGRTASARRCHDCQEVVIMLSSVLTTTACCTGTASVMMGMHSNAKPNPAMTWTYAATKMATATTMSCTVVTTDESATYAGSR